MCATGPAHIILLCYILCLMFLYELRHSYIVLQSSVIYLN